LIAGNPQPPGDSFLASLGLKRRANEGLKKTTQGHPRCLLAGFFLFSFFSLAPLQTKTCQKGDPPKSRTRFPQITPPPMGGFFTNMPKRRPTQGVGGD